MVVVLIISAFCLLLGFGGCLLHWKGNNRPQLDARHDEQTHPSNAKCQLRPSQTTLGKIAHVRSIVNFDLFDARAEDQLPLRLSLRARPNQRLITAFGLSNSFTTTDVAQHMRFLSSAKHAIGLVDHGDRWPMGRAIAMRVLSHPDFSLEGQKVVNLQNLVQALCFFSVVEILFSGHKVLELSIADRLTKDINRLWLASKEGDLLSRTAKEEQEDVIQSLRRDLEALIPQHKGEEALNLLIPAYETLWRVVLLAYVHVAFRNTSRETSTEVNEIVNTLMGTENKVPFCKISDKFSKEALRLYPPTKRVHRATDKEAFAADIEALHHNCEIWGLNAKEFRPSRFDAGSTTKVQREAYMPFGAQPHRCPAAASFGHRLIALLVACIVKKVGDQSSGLVISFGDEAIDGDKNATLPTGRADMAGWEISCGGQ